MKATNPWITYRTRFLVKAKQLTSSLTFTDILGRQHSGCNGDYLVESSDGVLRIQSRQIFEDIYVPLLASETPQPEETPPQPKTQLQYESRLLQETPRQRQTFPPPKNMCQRETPAILPLPPLLTRKSPQPYRDRRSPGPGLRSL